MTLPEQHEGELKVPVGFWVKLVLFLGFFLQFIFAFLFFVSIRYFEVFGVNAGSASLKLTFELLISLMPAVPLGFLFSNFIQFLISVYLIIILIITTTLFVLLLSIIIKYFSHLLFII